MQQFSYAVQKPTDQPTTQKVHWKSQRTLFLFLIYLYAVIHVILLFQINLFEQLLYIFNTKPFLIISGTVGKAFLHLTPA